MRRLALTLVGTLTLAAAAAGAYAYGARNPANLSLRELGQRAGEAYVFGLPLVLIDETRAVTLARAGAVQNQLVHRRDLPGFGDEEVVRPNRDTLYSIAWLDLSAGPVELAWPETGGRYWLFQVMDGWTDVAGAPGSRTQGEDPGRAFITGPDWRGAAPEGAVHIPVSTNTAWGLGRIAVSATQEDLAAGAGLQDGFTLSAPAGEAVRIPGGEGRPADTVATLAPEAFFERLAALMAENPPRPADAQAMDRYAAIGLASGGFDQDGHGFLARAASRRGVAAARARLNAAVGALPPGPNGWRTARAGLGDYGMNYALRAGVATIGLGANLPEDAIYPTASVDAAGEFLNGDHVYRLRFEAGETPPAGAFWSITAYDAEGFLLDTARHALGDRDALVYGEDGSLQIVIAASAPSGVPASNVLPVTPGAPFTLTARLYDPDARALAGSWTMPALERVD